MPNNDDAIEIKRKQAFLSKRKRVKKPKHNINNVIKQYKRIINYHLNCNKFQEAEQVLGTVFKYANQLPASSIDILDNSATTLHRMTKTDLYNPFIYQDLHVKTY